MSTSKVIIYKNDCGRKEIKHHTYESGVFKYVLLISYIYTLGVGKEGTI